MKPIQKYAMKSTVIKFLRIYCISNIQHKKYHNFFPWNLLNSTPITQQVPSHHLTQSSHKYKRLKYSNSKWHQKCNYATLFQWAFAYYANAAAYDFFSLHVLRLSVFNILLKSPLVNSARVCSITRCCGVERASGWKKRWTAIYRSLYDFFFNCALSVSRIDASK